MSAVSRPCPAGCVTPLRPLPVPAAQADACPACRGLWLPAGALNHMTGGPAPAPPRPAPGPAPTGFRLCPRDGKALAVYTYNRVVIDRCPHCQGLWLDEGELEEIKARFRRRQATDPLALAPEAALRPGHPTDLVAGPTRPAAKRPQPAEDALMSGVEFTAEVAGEAAVEVAVEGTLAVVGWFFEGLGSLSP